MASSRILVDDIRDTFMEMWKIPAGEIARASYRPPVHQLFGLSIMNIKINAPPRTAPVMPLSSGRTRRVPEKYSAFYLTARLLTRLATSLSTRDSRGPLFNRD